MRLFARFFAPIAILCFLFLLPQSVKAAGEFQTDYNVIYNVESSGRTNVTQEIKLTNKTANFYADKFELKIGSAKVDNVTASDSVGPMESQVRFEDNVTIISVNFNQRVIGIEKSLPWTLSYSSAELATKSGQIWEVSIPKVADSTDIATYKAAVNVPQEFGPIAFAVPEPKTRETLFKRQQYTYDKDQLTQSGIAMSFGEKQIFSFDLNYNLENKNFTTQIQNISLPPDNNYQKVVIEKIDPQPLDVVVDQDGNFLATYRLSPKDKKDIKVSGYVEVFSKPFRKIETELTNEQRELYIQPQPLWKDL